MSEKGRFIGGQFIPAEEQDTEGTAFYRCTLCGSVVSPWDIKEHKGCAKCANPRIKPTNLSLFEKLVQVVKHPKVWAWPK